MFLCWQSVSILNIVKLDRGIPIMKLTTASSEVLFEREAVIERKCLNLDVLPDARKQHTQNCKLRLVIYDQYDSS